MRLPNLVGVSRKLRRTTGVNLGVHWVVIVGSFAAFMQWMNCNVQTTNQISATFAKVRPWPSCHSRMCQIIWSYSSDGVNSGRTGKSHWDTCQYLLFLFQCGISGYRLSWLFCQLLSTVYENRYRSVSYCISSTPITIWWRHRASYYTLKLVILVTCVTGGNWRNCGRDKWILSVRSRTRPERRSADQRIRWSMITSALRSCDEGT